MNNCEDMPISSGKSGSVVLKHAVRIFAVILFGCCVAGTGALAVEYHQDLRDGKLDLHTLRVIGSSSYLHRGKDGLRITIPGSVRDASNAGVSYPLHLVGDCELQAAVKLLDVPTPAAGYGTGVALLLEDGVDRGASLQLIRTSDGQRQYIAHHFVVDAEGAYHHSAMGFPAESEEIVRLRMRRIGDKLQYEVSEVGQTEFRKLHEVPFSQHPLSIVQVYGQIGGEPNQLSILLQELHIAADSVGRSGEKSGNGKTAWWITAGLFTGIPLFVGGIAWYWRQRRR